jgi:hypothetical protein
MVGVVFVSEAFAQESVESNDSQPRAEAEAESAPAPVAEPAPTGAATRDDHLRALGALDVTERVNAARALAELADPETVPALTQALRSDPNPIVRGWIVRALGEINNAQARAAITVAAQQDADERVRELAGQLIPEARAATPQVYDPAMYAHVETSPRRQRRPGHGLRVGGWIVLGSSYGISMIMGMVGMLMEPELMWPMLLPIVGPAVSGTLLIQEGWDELIVLGIIGWVMSAAQIAGLTMAIVGHVRGRRAREEETASRRSIALTPMAGPNGLVGLSAVGSF